MDPRVLTYLADVNKLTEAEIQISEQLLKMYITGLVEADWNNGNPLFSLSISGREEFLIAQAYARPLIQE